MDFEEVWESDKGVTIETYASTRKIWRISIFVPEMLLDNFFDECNW